MYKYSRKKYKNFEEWLENNQDELRLSLDLFQRLSLLINDFKESEKLV